MALVIGLFNFRKNGNFPIYCPKFGQKAPNLKTSILQKNEKNYKNSTIFWKRQFSKIWKKKQLQTCQEQ